MVICSSKAMHSQKEHPPQAQCSPQAWPQLQIADFLAPESAQLIADFLAQSDSWRHLLNVKDRTWEVPSGDWDALPAITYCVGFVRAYANAVGLDGALLGRELREKLGFG